MTTRRHGAHRRDGDGPGTTAATPPEATPVPRACATTGAADDLLVDHLVVGSGYGGSVVAERLTEAGHAVVMLEMGREWNVPGDDGKVFTPMLRQDARSMWFRDRSVMPLSTFLGLPTDRSIGYGPGVLDRVDFARMSVYAGRGVGGGSLVNGGMAVAPPRDLVEERLPTLDADAFFATWIPRAQAGLGVCDHDDALIETSPYYRFARVGRSSAQAAGLKVVGVPSVYDRRHLVEEAAGRAPASATAGEVIFGNNHGKKDLTKTYLARARATGRLTVHTLVKAVGVTRRSDGRWSVTTERIEQDGSTTPGPRWHARHLYLGAGSIGTTELLLRSQAEGLLPDLPDAVGHGWAPNGNIMVGRANHLWSPTGVRQSTIPVFGIDHWTGVPQAERVFAEIAPVPAGVDTFVSLYLAIVDNPRRGVFGWDPVAERLELDWGPDHAAPGVAAARKMFDRINAAAGTIYRRDLFGGGKIFSDHFTYHPLGGAVLGEATDADGRLLGHDRLYILDGSLVPGVAGVNPFVTITALAEMIAAGVVRSL